MRKKNLLSLLIALLCGGLLQAQMWTGAASSAWNNAANWNNNTVPLATDNVSIPGTGITNWPQLTGNITMASLTMSIGSRLDVNGFSVTASNNITVDSAILSNSSSTTDIVFNLPGNNESDFGRSTINDHITFVITGNGTFDEGFPAGDHFTGNATFNISGTGDFSTSYSAASQYNGNLSISRPAAGASFIFRSGANTVGGNFSFSGAGGQVQLGNSLTNRTNIGGMVDITNSGTGTFNMYYLVNSTAGGHITLQNTGSTSILMDTLLVDNIAVSGLKNGCNFQNNKISGNCSLADDAVNTSEIDFGGNYIGGNFTAAVNGTGSVYEGYPSGNHFAGNATFNMGGTGSFFTAYTSASQYNGNLNITRTVAGASTIFNNGPCTIGGNFSFTSIGGVTTLGTVYIYNITHIGGTVNIANSGTGTFSMYHLVNNTTGGNVTVQSAGQVNISLDTLLVSNIAISGLKNGLILSNNKITGAGTFSDDASNTTEIDFGGNYLDGSFTDTLKGTGAIYEGFPGGNHFTGDVMFHINGTGTLNTAYQGASQYDGDLSITRAVTGVSNIFRNGTSTVGGDFNFTGAGGVVNLGTLLNKTNISGMVNITNSGTDIFNLYGLANNTMGGIIAINTTGRVDVEKDTLLAAKVSFNGLSGIGGYSTIYYNAITADSISVSDNAAATAETVDFGNNLFAGNFTANFQSAGPAYDGVGGGNHYTGNATFHHSGSGQLTIGYNNNNPRFDKDFSLNEATYNMTLITNASFGGASNGHIIQSGVQAIVLQKGSINKTGGATLILDNDVAVATNFDFVSGNIISSTNKEPVFGFGATATNASNTSHVVGPVSKVGNNAFVFPIGTGTSLNTAAISVPSPDTSFPFDNKFRAQYFRSDPVAAGYDTALHASTVVKVSGCEYWDIERVTGSNNVSVSLGFSSPCTNSGSGYISDPAKLRLMHWNGTLWEDLGNGGTTGTSVNGTITSAATVTGFSPFGLGTTDMGANPLPLRLLSFTGKSQTNTNWLQWTTANEQNTKTFEMERSSDGSNFNVIGYIAAIGSGNNSYSFTDLHPVTGNDFYRLKMVDIDGKSAYSNIITLSGQQMNRLTIYPNPTTGTVVLRVDDENLINTNVSLCDISGRLLQNIRITANSQTLSLDKYPAGIYLLKWANGKVMKVLKQ